MITVEKTNTDLRVTIPKDAVPPKRLNALLDWLRLEEIAHRSRLSEADADQGRVVDGQSSSIHPAG
jgi:hypothetical protein